ncbi:36344_t:CDS:1 [Gigaspora margarita]|uniref:36344_t:CDS:1 n=1 Tax=Gigaspora margarita TaxID=4874 RepID=A0ABN7VQZ1_GIGMA|nr:36344_t:CDS:1 [Gigaspora margarita]
MPFEINENGTDSSDEVTHLEFIGDSASDYDYKVSTSSKDITLLEKFLESACKKQKTSCSSSLRSLKITYYSKLLDNKILHLYPNITSLNFEQSESFTNASLTEIARSYPNLESLNICGNQNITGQSIYKIAQSCKKLRYLDIGFCGNITNDFVYKTVKASCKLELLCIGGLKRYKPISDRTISAIAHSCPNLYHLSLKGCHNITDNSVNKLFQHIYNLKFLELDQCRFITDSSICNIANSCPKLEHLDIGACDASNASICNIVHSCKKLKYLNIRCCRLITDIVINEIAQHCSNLEFLSIVGTNITKDALSELNPKIKIKRDLTLEIKPEKELNDLRTSLVYLVQDL